MSLNVGGSEFGAVYVGGTAVSRVYVGTSQVWPASTGVYYADNFNRANGSLGANWTKQFGDDMSITSNEVRANTGLTTKGGGYMYTSPFTSLDQMVKLKAGSTGGSSTQPGQSLVLRANATSGVCMWISGTSANSQLDVRIYTFTAGWQIGPTASATGKVQRWTGGGISGKSMAAGDQLAFSAVGNVYTCYHKGVALGSWVDSGNLFTYDATNNGGGFGADPNSIYTQGSVDDFEMMDM